MGENPDLLIGSEDHTSNQVRLVYTIVRGHPNANVTIRDDVADVEGLQCRLSRMLKKSRGHSGTISI
jgi:hypothetical protein